jgi:hypothetical protein
MELRFTFGPPAWIDWRDTRFYRTRTGYYAERSGHLLHRLVYEATVGPIPDGHDLHHIDGDKSNNAAANLAPVEHGEHTLHHGNADSPAFVAQQDPTVASERARRYWARRQPHLVVCAECGTEFSSTGQRATFCTPTCRARAIRARRREALTASTDV